MRQAVQNPPATRLDPVVRWYQVLSTLLDHPDAISLDNGLNADWLADHVKPYPECKK